MHIRFNVHCDDCGQQLSTPDGENYKHNNDDDCASGGVCLPRVTPDDLRALLAAPLLAELNVEAQDALKTIQDAEAKPTKKPRKPTKKGK